MSNITLNLDEFKKQHPDSDGRAMAAYIQHAIDLTADGGGGCVALGNGNWQSTTIILRSAVELKLMRGCRLIAEGDMSQYRALPHTETNAGCLCRSLIYANNVEHTALTGPGTIDGSCMAFWEPCRDESEWPHGIFRYKRRKQPGSIGSLVQMKKCRDVVIDGISIVNSPGWTVHVYNCDHASVRNVVIRNNRLIPYTDGININGSRDVRISHCDVDTGDDAIIIKATEPDLLCARVTVTNCVASSNCSAFGLGADAAGTIRDVVFSHCVSARSLRMIQVEQWYAGTIERAIFSNITGRTFPDEGVTCERPIYVDIQQWTRQPESDTPDTPPALGQVRDLIFHSILCETRGRLVLTAQDGSRIENISLDNIHLRIPEIEDPASTVPSARSMQLSNFNPETRAARAALVADNVTGLHIHDVSVSWPASPDIDMQPTCLRNCQNVRMESPELTGCQASER